MSNEAKLQEKIEVLITSGKLEESKDLVLKLIDSTSKQSDFHTLYVIALYYYSISDLSTAMDWIGKIGQDSDLDLDVVILKGKCLQGLEKHQDAVDIFQHCLQKNPASYDINYLNAVSLTELKSYDDALKSLKKCLALRADDQQIYSQMGTIYLALGNYSEAKSNLNKALELDPSNFLVMMKLANLETTNPKMGVKEKFLSMFGKFKNSFESGISSDFVKGILKKPMTKMEEIKDQLESIHETISTPLLEKINFIRNDSFTLIKDLITRKDNSKSEKLDVLNRQLDEVLFELRELRKKGQENEQQLQELNDRNQKLETQMKLKLDDFEANFKAELELLSLSDKQKNSLIEYHDGFVSHFNLVYTASLCIVDGSFNLKTKNGLVSLISTLLSLIPTIGSTISSTFSSVADFIKSTLMIQKARLIVNLYPDHLSLSQFTRDLVASVVKNDEKRKLILSKNVNSSIDTLLSRVIKLLSDLSEKVDSTLYGKHFKSEFAKRGSMDSVALLTNYFSSIELQKLEKSELKAEFAKFLLVSAAQPHSTPDPKDGTSEVNSKDQILRATESDKARCRCCLIF